MNHKIRLCLILVFLFARSSVFASNAPLLSDAQKKTIVYDMYQNYKTNDFPDVPDIHPREAIALAKSQQAVFVDLRESAEMEVSILPDAVTQKTFLGNPQKYIGKTIIAYCTISYRSGRFVQEMQKKKIPVVNLKGGLLAWVLEGGKVYDQNGETHRIHVYGKKWNYPATGYEAVYFGFFEKLFK